MKGASTAFYVLFTTFILALVSLVQLFSKTSPLLFAHMINFCQKNLSNVIITLPNSLPLMIIGGLFLILVIGVMTLGIQVYKTRKYIQKNLNKRTIIEKKYRQLFTKLNIESSLDIVKDTRFISFSYGLFRPRICISTGLIYSLTKQELKAVILHERYHKEHFDPLKVILSKTASLMFFFLPLLRDLQKSYGLSKEIEADHNAVKDGNKEELISALSKFLSNHTPQLNGIAALAETESLEERLLHLTEQKNHTAIRISKKHFASSFVIVLLTIVTLSSPIHAVAMTSMAMDSTSTTYYICPFGDSCLAVCKQNMKKNDIMSQEESHAYSSIPYTKAK